ncbi:MAG: TetR family transcriptional regulator [Burkholderiales bacterium]|nr:TetR family transcriptional regulator [Burkholderiales bacterium]
MDQPTATGAAGVTPRKIRKPLVEAEFLAAACAIVERDGLAGLALRPLAQALDVSVTVLTNRYGARLDVIAAIGRAACAEEQRLFAPWRRRIAALGTLTPQTAADLAEALLDQLAGRERAFSLLFVEMVQACAWDESLRPLFRPWFDARGAFWDAFGARCGMPRELLASGLLNGYFVDELAFAIALGEGPAYRLLRRIGLRRLFAGLRADVGPSDDAALFALLVDDLEYPSDALAVMHGAALAPDWRGEAARASAVLIATRGVGAVTHRAIAAAAGVPHTTLAYRFPMQQDLVIAGLEHIISNTLQSVARGDYKPLGTMEPTDDERGYGVGPATFAVAIAAARMPALVPCAADMRRRRGINLHRILEQRGQTAFGIDALAAQVIAIGAIGATNAAALHAGGGVERSLGAAVDWARQRAAERPAATPPR